MKRKWTALAIFLQIGLCLGLFLRGAEAKNSITPEGSINMEAVLKPGPFKDMVEGREDAPITIVEYASVTCAHCAEFFTHTLPSIKEKYIKTGKARFIFRDFPYDPRATAAFMIARCSPPQNYLPFIHVLYEQIQDWAFVKDSLTPLHRISRLSGLSDKQFSACLNNTRLLQELKTCYERGLSLGITATPTFFINGKKYVGAFTVEEFSKILDGFLKK